MTNGDEPPIRDCEVEELRMMESLQEIVDAAKRSFQRSAQVAEIIGSTSSHAPNSHGIYTMCEKEGMV